MRDDGLLNYFKMVEIADSGDKVFLLRAPVPRIVLGRQDSLALKITQTSLLVRLHTNRKRGRQNNRLNQTGKAVLPNRKLRFEYRLSFGHGRFLHRGNGHHRAARLTAREFADELKSRPGSLDPDAAVLIDENVFDSARLIE